MWDWIALTEVHIPNVEGPWARFGVDLLDPTEEMRPCGKGGDIARQGIDGVPPLGGVPVREKDEPNLVVLSHVLEHGSQSGEAGVEP